MIDMQKLTDITTILCTAKEPQLILVFCHDFSSSEQILRKFQREFEFPGNYGNVDRANRIYEWHKHKIIFIPHQRMDKYRSYDPDYVFMDDWTEDIFNSYEAIRMCQARVRGKR